jgi:hypothetical protein
MAQMFEPILLCIEMNHMFPIIYATIFGLPFSHVGLSGLELVETSISVSFSLIECWLHVFHMLQTIQLSSMSIDTFTVLFNADVL